MRDDDIGVTKVEKMRKVTFSTGLPRGTCATFNYEGYPWEAFPRAKMAEIRSVQTRTIAMVERVHQDLVAWINNHPEDTVRVVQLLARTNRAKQLISDSNEAWTMIEGGFNGEGTDDARQGDRSQGSEEDSASAADGSGRDQ